MIEQICISTTLLQHGVSAVLIVNLSEFWYRINCYVFLLVSDLILITRQYSFRTLFRMLTSYSNRSATFDKNQKILINNIFYFLQETLTRISVSIMISERIILEQKISYVSSSLDLLTKAITTLEFFISGPNVTNNISTSSNGITVFNLASNISNLLPDLGNPHLQLQECYLILI